MLSTFTIIAFFLKHCKGNVLIVVPDFYIMYNDSLHFSRPFRCAVMGIYFRLYYASHI